MVNYKVYDKLFDTIRCQNDIGDKYHTLCMENMYIIIDFVTTFTVYNFQ